MHATGVGVVADRGHVSALVAVPLSLNALLAITPASTSTRARGLTVVVVNFGVLHRSQYFWNHVVVKTIIRGPMFWIQW